MTVLQRYFASEIIRAVMFVLAAFLGLFAFFGLMDELESVGQGGYKLQHAFLYILLGLPNYVYELMPIAALIGTIFALAQFASHSEFTIMRASSMSTFTAGMMLAKIGIVFAIITIVFGELVAPVTTQLASKLKFSLQGAAMSQQFRSGLWTKDIIKTNGVTGAVVGSRFVNVAEVKPNGQLNDVRLYEFDKDFRLAALITAKKADYQKANIWQLSDVTETRFSGAAAAGSTQDITAAISTVSAPTKPLVSDITPKILSVLFADPDRMSTYDLALYTRHLTDNKQDSERYEIAFWKKLIYPFVVFVMMALALPFAYLHFRSGGVSLKIFTGIMIGVSFKLINDLFSHLGLLNTWPPLITAILPSAVFMTAAIMALRRMDRR
ncbi:LPS export ABC transporter permease LptG [Undibacterium arcticum]|uniref:LPS export ABC transporter permease LptG n=1 Tax=Undibacterium arcticum TaxID=1762892 RepID=A0ABV7F238_9BURK